MNNKDTIARFIAGATSGRNSTRSLFIEGDTLFSYGHHYPLARRLADGKLWINSERYSVTTSKQRGFVISGAARAGVEVTA